MTSVAQLVASEGLPDLSILDLLSSILGLALTPRLSILHPRSYILVFSAPTGGTAA